MDYAQALKQLEYPDSWCEAAHTLVALGDPKALTALIAAYEQPFEASRRCLLDAMEAFNPIIAAHDLFDGSSGDKRRMAVHLMELFASNDHLSRLKIAVSDSDMNVRAQARSALAGQFQTPDWETMMISLLAHDDAKMRAQAVTSLSRRFNEVIRAAFQQRLIVEPDGDLKSEIERLLTRSK